MRRFVLTLLAAAALTACGEDNRPDDIIDPARGDGVARIVPAGEALEGVHLPPLDPSSMTLAEVDAAIDAPTVCLFRYTSGGQPVVATGFGADQRPLQGVVKLAGNLVLLDPAPGEREGEYRLEAGDIRIVVSPLEADGRRAEMTFAVGEALHAGYGGFHDCRG